MEITLAPEVLFAIGNIEITNSVFTSFFVFFIIIVLFSLISSKFKIRNPGKFQLVIEFLIMGLFGMLKDIMGLSKAKSIFGFVFTLFIFILVSNWFGLLPFALTTVWDHSNSEHTASNIEEEIAEEQKVINIDEHGETQEETTHTGEINFMSDCISKKECYLTTSGIKKFEKKVHVFRAPSSDLSATLSLALISVFTVNFLGLKELKFGYIKKFLYIFNLPALIKQIRKVVNTKDQTVKESVLSSIGLVFTFLINSFVGILEIVSEFGKIISFSFRLLGNIFAGEVLLAILTSLTFGLATLPFLGLELFVGIIQALVFFMLTSVFISLAITEHH
ncbi:F0F1 ATP synthase subunit A [Candidatus Dojkabacteria bacterium]|nr:F0F1 ATP synthase subunit A [Candidatus Dojkabacteria bacterium]